MFQFSLIIGLIFNYGCSGASKIMSEYMQITGLDASPVDDMIHLYYTDGQWIDINCKLIYPHELAYKYNARWMWWTVFDDSNYVVNLPQVDSNRHQIYDKLIFLQPIRMKLTSYYDGWKIECKHGYYYHGRTNDYYYKLNKNEKFVSVGDIGLLSVHLHYKNVTTNNSKSKDTQGPGRYFLSNHMMLICIISGLILILLVNFICLLCCCVRKRRQRQPRPQLSGITNENDTILYAEVYETNNKFIPNKLYEKADYAEIDHKNKVTSFIKANLNNNVNYCNVSGEFNKDIDKLYVNTKYLKIDNAMQNLNKC